MGVGIVLVIFIDVMIVRMFFVFFFMKLFGDVNWWFFIKKYDKFSFNE